MLVKNCWADEVSGVGRKRDQKQKQFLTPDTEAQREHVDNWIDKMHRVRFLTRKYKRIVFTRTHAVVNKSIAKLTRTFAYDIRNTDP